MRGEPGRGIGTTGRASPGDTRRMAHLVRAVTPLDISAIEAVYYRSWRSAYEPFLDPELLETLAAQRSRDFDWLRAIRSPDAAVLVGVDGGSSVLGVAQVNEALHAPRDLPEITMLYVDPPAWGSGIASSLMDGGLAWIAGRGHTSARLRVVENHHRARRFYEREGWTLEPRLAPVTTELARLVYYRRDVHAL